MRRLFGKQSEHPAASDALASGLEVLHDRGILAHWYIEHRLVQEVDRARRYRRPLAVMVASPTLLPGERLAPEAAEAAAEAARSAGRSTDLVGWADGDQILILMPETKPDDARIGVSRLRDHMWRCSRSFGGQKWEITALNDPNEFGTVEILYETLRAKHAGETAA